MLPDLDGAETEYSGDILEEKYRSTTFAEMPYWWHFHEVLQASAQSQVYWQKSSGAPLSDSEQQIMVALSLSSYGVYCGIAEAMAFLEQIEAALITNEPEEWQLCEARRAFKAAYSALYTGYATLCNIVYSLWKHQAPWGYNRSEPRVKMPGKVLEALTKSGLIRLADPLSRVAKRLEIRHQFDHFWTVWTYVGKGQFLLDSHFTKGYVVIDPDRETDFSVNAVKMLLTDIEMCQREYNPIYYELAVSDGLLDHFLAHRGWKIDYSNKTRTGGKRPMP